MNHNIEKETQKHLLKGNNNYLMWKKRILIKLQKERILTFFENKYIWDEVKISMANQ